MAIFSIICGAPGHLWSARTQPPPTPDARSVEPSSPRRSTQALSDLARSTSIKSVSIPRKRRSRSRLLRAPRSSRQGWFHRSRIRCRWRLVPVRFGGDPVGGIPSKKLSWPPAALLILSRCREPTPARAASITAPCRPQEGIRANGRGNLEEPRLPSLQGFPVRRNELSLVHMRSVTIEGRGSRGRIRRMIEIGGPEFTRHPLPHHRTYGSVYGGSEG